MITLLDKYTKIIKKIEYISLEIDLLKKITYDKIRNEQNESKKKEIYNDFLLRIEKIKNDKEKKQKYDRLLRKKRELYNNLSEKIKENELTFDYFTTDDTNINLNNEEISLFDSKKGDLSEDDYKVDINKIQNVLSKIIMKYKKPVDINNKISNIQKPVLNAKIPKIKISRKSRHLSETSMSDYNYKSV